MTEKEVIDAIEYMQKYQTETDKVEAKAAEKGCPQKCYDTISAFANKCGGIIIFGINEHNNFIEQDVYDVNDLQKQITSLCTTSFEPKIRPEFLAITYNGKKLLAVKINEIPQKKKPCYYKNVGIKKGSYIRIGDSDEPMTDYEIYSLQSYTDGIEEDLRPVKRAEFEDLNQEKIVNYLTNIKKDKPNLSKFSDEKILKLNGIIENSTEKIRPTLAGMMVFGEYPQGYLPQLFIACVVVPGRKLGDIGEMGQRFDDNKRVEGTIEEMLEASLSFVRKNIPARVIIDDNGKREDVPIYPMKALREAIANALIHRDYSSNTEGAYIYLRIFDDRIEILNPGDLYGNNRIENLGTDNMLEVRNNTIIRLLEEATDIVENRHTGIATMRDEMKKMNLPEPEFETLRGTFKVTFRKEKQEIIAQNITENCTDNFTENCTDNEIKLLGLLKINPNITQVELSNKLNVSRRTISTLLSHLKERGKIERVGSDRKGYWKILK